MAQNHSTDFYLTLPSNSSLKYFPENNAAEFKTKLAQTINLRGTWEVALAEIQYCRSWTNVSDDMLFYYGTPASPRRLTIEAGYYETLEDLLDILQNKLDETVKDQIKFKYRKHIGKVQISLSNDIEIHWLDRSLSRLLGMTRKTTKGNGLHKSDTPVPRQIPNPDMFVYTDAATPVLVGDSFVPLLRIVTPTGKHGERVVASYDKMHYVPVRMVNIDTLEINISSDSGNLVQFNFGRTVVKLHFRPKKLSYL